LSNVYAKQMNPSKLPVSDDLSSTGYALTENVGPASDEAEINFTGVTFGQTTFSSGIILVSTSLSEDLTAWMSCVSLATPRTEACDAVGGALRPEWRERPESYSLRSELPPYRSVSS
jgi:hypothetical protein